MDPFYKKDCKEKCKDALQIGRPNRAGRKRKMNTLLQYGDTKSEMTFLCFEDYEAGALLKAGAPRVILVKGFDNKTLQTLANQKSLEAFNMFYTAGDIQAERAETIRTYIEGAHKWFFSAIIQGDTIDDTTRPYGLSEDRLKSLIDTVNEGEAERKRVKDEQRRQKLLEDYEKTSAGAKITDFFDGILHGATTHFIPTGHPMLDKALNGGLYPCFYCVGGISSVGKTAFVMQIADQVAAAGRDVLIFSLEMSEAELIGRSISRHTFERVKNTPEENRAKSEQQITTRAFWSKYTKAELDLIQAAANDYRTYADHIHIFEGVGNISAADIKQKILEHMDLKQETPLVIIDYLQIIKGEDPRETDKQRVDNTVLEIKRITRDLCLPIIAISSFNRESYTEPVTMASFKESGAVEYSSDCLIGLQYYGMDYEGTENKNKHLERVRQLFDEQNEKGKAGRPQDLQVKILKNRKGYKEKCVKFAYYPRYSYFENPNPPKDKDGFVPCANAGARQITENKITI